jgi:lysyl-tRNA synthetase class I
MDLNNLDPDQIKGLISLLQNLLPTEQNTSDDEEVQPDTMRIKTQKSKKSKSKFRNKFDQMAESKMHKEDIIIDQKLSKLPPVPRTRQFTPINVVCRVCGKRESVNPNLVDSIERYKCNKCCSSGGA